MDFCPEIEEGKHINLPTLHGWNSQHTFLAPSWRMTNMHELITPTQQGRILARLQPYKLCKSHISPTKSNNWNILKLIDIGWAMVSFWILTRCLDSPPNKWSWKDWHLAPAIILQPYIASINPPVVDLTEMTLIFHMPSDKCERQTLLLVWFPGILDKTCIRRGICGMNAQYMVY